MVRIKIRYLALKIAYFGFLLGMIIFPGGVRKKMEIPEVRGVHFVSLQYFGKSRGEGGHKKYPLREIGRASCRERV